ncbi:MAG TPA: hypothetical protein VFO24_11810, partial [Usitatibacter sp.]|nr:hypothetical protein [Usitatibacter sp.]
MAAILASLAFAAAGQVPPSPTPPADQPPTAVLQVVPAATPGMPAPAEPAASPHPAYVVAEPTSGLPPGRLIPLPMIPEKRIRELETDLALHLQITAGYRRASADEEAAIAHAPEAITGPFAMVRDEGGARRYVRLGYVLPPRRLPQLWVQAFSMSGTQPGPNPDAEPATLDAALKQIFTERAKIFSRLRLADLATATIPLSYVDADAALFALRAMGYSAVTDSESLAKDDSYSGDDVDVMEGTRAAQGAPAAPPAPDA